MKSKATITNLHYQCREWELVVDSLFEQIGQSKSLYHMVETLHVIDRYQYEIRSPGYSENEYNNFMEG